MNIPIYQVDAFASEVFKGNPVAVCILDKWPDNAILQAIAAENNLPETAFLHDIDGEFELRWFKPQTEVSLCGHAILASAFIIFNCLNWPEATIHFQTRQSGVLIVTKKGELLEMDFPPRPPVEQETPDSLADALAYISAEVLGSAEDLLVIFEDEHTVRGIDPNLPMLVKGKQRGTIVTAPGDECDFVSRFFAPRVGIPEDLVTGSVHCVLVPYWSQRLGKKKLHARQVSKRGRDYSARTAGNISLLREKPCFIFRGQ